MANSNKKKKRKKKRRLLQIDANRKIICIPKGWIAIISGPLLSLWIIIHH